MVKTLKSVLLWNQKADVLESWYVALDTQVLPFFSNDDCVDLDLFYGEVKFGRLCFRIGKR